MLVQSEFVNYLTVISPVKLGRGQIPKLPNSTSTSGQSPSQASGGRGLAAPSLSPYPPSAWPTQTAQRRFRRRGPQGLGDVTQGGGATSMGGAPRGSGPD